MEPTSKDKENVVNPDVNLSKRTESPNKDGDDVSKKRPRNHNHNNDDSISTQPAEASTTLPATALERVPFGTFSRGNQIYRNRIVTDGDDAAKETQSEGFYSIEELVLPHCTAALCTSFTASRNAVSWFQRVFHGIPQLTVMVPGPVDIGHAMVTPMMNMEVEIPIVGEGIQSAENHNEKNEAAAAAAVTTATTINNKRFVPVPHWYFHNNGKSTKANNEPEKRDKEGTKKSLTNSKSATATANATKKDKRKESRLPTTSTATTPSSDENKKTFLPIPQWYWVSARPENTGGCLHAKVLLFRSPQGLRVIVAGCNLSRRQWETARDVFWVQDFPLIVNDKTAAASWGYDPYDPRGFKDKLETFLQQVMKCDEDEAKRPNSKTSTSNTATKTRQTKQHKLISRRITSILEGVDFSKARALLVVSFPRRVEKNTQGVRVKDVYRHHKYGGWKQLALVVHQALLDQGMLADDDSSNSSCCSDDDNHRKRKPVTYAAADRRLYVTSGSLGNLEPGFIWQMHQAMNGEQVEPQQQQWKDVEDHFRCFWPSARTSKTMDVLGLMGALRPMPRRHVQSIPSTSRQKMLHDAIPNPNTKSKTAFQRYHNKLLKMSSSASTTTAKKNDNSQPHPPTLAFAPVTHGKFMYNRRGVLYVGSHNFSRSAWGERNAQPKNVEVGVVLATPRQAEQEAWIRRLPCHVDVDTDPPKLSSNYEPFVGRWTIQHHCHPLAYLLPPERQEKNDGNDDDDDDSGDESSVGAFMDDFY